ncbi:peptidoglycan-binding protein [Georgenia yuyongxinii]
MLETEVRSEHGVGRKSSPRRRGAVSVLAFVLSGLLVGAGLGWAGRILLAPPPALPEAASHSVVQAQQGSVERRITLDAAATWSDGTVFPNQAEGTVTRVHLDGPGTVQPGDALYDVNLVPVRVAVGTVPAFRDLTAGISGDDVRQLQDFLRRAGFRTAAPNGKFDARTTGQVKAWQRSVGRESNGTITLGEVLFVPTLPATVALGDGISVGSVVSRGNAAPQAEAAGAADGFNGPVLIALPAAPSFTIPLPENQAGMVREGMLVELARDGAIWPARIASVGLPDGEGTAVATLGPREGSASICGDDCSTIPVAGEGALSATIELVAPTNGVKVPTAALVVAPAGGPAVTGADGTPIPVQVLASAGGEAVVEGVSAGQEIRVPGRDVG